MRRFKQTVYVDVLLAINFFINYFIMLSTAKILRSKISRTRICLSAIFGAFSALSIFLPASGALLSCLLKFAISAVMVLIAFKWSCAKVFVRHLAVACLVTFGFGGVMLALWVTVAPNGMYYRNGVTYFNVSPMFIIITTLICYTFITAASKICVSRERRAARYNVTVCNNGRAAALTIIGDTGNMLSEPFSGYPVMIVKRSSIKKVLPEDFDRCAEGKCSDCSAGFRIIPYSSVGGTGLLSAFMPQKMRLADKSGSRDITNCYIAVSDSLECEEYDGIINPSALSK